MNNYFAPFALALMSSVLFISGCDTSDGLRQGQIVNADDPIVQDFPIAYVERPLPLDEDGNPFVDEVFNPTAFNPGARLILKARATATAAETVLTDALFPARDDGSPALYDVKDLSVSADGKRLLFALRAPEIENASDDEQPTWNIWQYDSVDGSVRRIITSAIRAEEGQDVAPYFTEDGRIVFSSTRQRRTRALLTDEGKSQYAGLDEELDNEALVLHVMDTDGEDIEQISFNASHDVEPTVLESGEIAYLRWDALGNNDAASLYKMNTDGSNNQPWFGYHSQTTGSNGDEAVLTHFVEGEDGRLVALLRPRQTVRLGGAIVALDSVNFFAADTPINTSAGASGQTSLTSASVVTPADAISRGGTFSSLAPLYDGTGRLLVSWSQCRIIDPSSNAIRPCTDFLLSLGAEAAAPLFGLWIYDPKDQTQLPVKIPAEGTMFSGAVALAPRPQPAFYSPPARDDDLVTEALGVVHIRSIYDRDGEDTTADGIVAMRNPALTPQADIEARFIRITKHVPIPDDDVLDFDDSAYGVSRNQLMRDILGYVPIEPDGSVMFKAPADMPLMLDVVDANGQRIGGRHQNWFTVRPGEVRNCTGCHSRGSEVPHGRPDAEPASANPGAVGGVNFANTRLLDPFGVMQPPPEPRESMAEYRARVAGDAQTPSVDLLYTDVWTNPAAATAAPDLSLRYIDIQTAHVLPGAPATSKNPADARCAPLENTPPLWRAPTTCINTGSWSSQCRVTINYRASIHPLWEADRRSCDEFGNVMTDHTCTSCHTRGPADMLQVPAGQLELTGEVSQDRNDYITSYAELMFEDIKQDVIDNSLVNLALEIRTGEFETDAEGNLVLDELGNPIEIIELEPIILPVPMSADGARASERFFSRFAAGASHAGYLTSAELKLLAEWLDIGGQYYNDPFDAPAN